MWVIALASLAYATMLESLVIESLGIAASANVSQRETIAGQLRDKNVLLVFDNCGHVVDVVAVLLGGILSTAPEVRVLATTQLPHNNTNKRKNKQVPFGLDGTDGDNPAARFLAHCYTAQGEQLNDTERDAVDRICRAFDGLALPLKLAASQAAIVGMVAVEQQLHRLPDGDATGRSSLRGSMEWSYGLLTDEGRRVFRSLGVFHGSFSSAAAAEVGGPGADTALRD